MRRGHGEIDKDHGIDFSAATFALRIYPGSESQATG